MGIFKQFDIRIRSGGDDAIAAVSELLPRWVPVDEQLPGVGAEVMVFDKVDGRRVAALCEQPDAFRGTNVQFWSHASCEDALLHVTHWMPLPEPPAA